MKKSTRVRMVKVGTKLMFWCILIGLYSGLLDFAIRCKIESDNMFFALIGIMFIAVVMFGIILWTMIFDPIMSDMDRICKIHIRNENKEFIDRRKHISEMKFNENLKEMHRKFDDLERSRFEGEDE